MEGAEHWTLNIREEELVALRDPSVCMHRSGRI